jgi:hypothetical protein
MRLVILTLIFSAACLNAHAQTKLFEGDLWTNLHVAAQDKSGQIIAGNEEQSRWWRWNENWQPSYNNSPWSWSGSGYVANEKVVALECASVDLIYSLWNHPGEDGATLMVHSRA